MNILRFLPLLFLLTFSWTAQAQHFGVGIVVGNPTGLTAKVYQDKNHAIDAAIAWTTRDGGGFHIHGDYLWENANQFRLDGKPIGLFYGLGGRWIVWSDADRHDDHDYSMGIRFPIGLSYNFNKPDIEVFVEIPPVFEFAPDTDLDIDFGIGGRFYF